MELILLVLLLGGLLFAFSFFFKQVNSIFLIFSGLLLILSSSFLFVDDNSIIKTTNEIYNYNYSYNPPLLLNSTEMPVYYTKDETNLFSWFLLLIGIYIMALAGFDLKNGRE